MKDFCDGLCCVGVCSKRCYFVDLFVRASNQVAVMMYEKLNYSIYRRVLEYYSGEQDEDALGMCQFFSASFTISLLTVSNYSGYS